MLRDLLYLPNFVHNSSSTFELKDFHMDVLTIVGILWACLYVNELVWVRAAVDVEQVRVQVKYSRVNVNYVVMWLTSGPSSSQ